MDAMIRDMLRRGDADLNRGLAESFAADRDRAISEAAQDILNRWYPEVAR